MNINLHQSIKLLTILILLSFECFGQDQLKGDNFIVCNSKVEEIDSSYYLVLTYSVDNDDTIHILQNRQYSLQSEEGIDEINFWRVTRGFGVRQCRDFVSQPVLGYVNPYSLMIDKHHPFQDSVLLDRYLPFEKGEYLVAVKISYKHLGKINWKQLNPQRFHVKFVPKLTLARD